MISSRDLCTLAGAKAYISAKLVSSVDDPLLQKLITRASGWIEELLSRRLGLAAFSERRNGTGTASIMARHYPIVAVQSVWIGNRQVEVAPVSTAGAAQSLTGGGYLPSERFIYLRYEWFRRGVQNVLLQYQAGYLTPGLLALAALPAWQAESNYALGGQLIANGLVLQALNPGQSGAAAPAWPSAPGALVTDGQVNWLATEAYLGPTAGAQLLPAALEVAAIELVALQYRQKDRAGDSGTGLGPERVNYFTGAMSATTKESLKPFRDTVPPVEVMP